MPRSMYQRVRSSIQYWCHSASSPGLTKNSISICSNSRVRKMKLPGVISLRKLLPVWAMPNGGFLPRGLHDVVEVDEDALGRLGAQVVQARLVLDDAEVGLEHHLEVARLGPPALGAAVGAHDVGHRDRVGVGDALLLRERLLQVVLAAALVAVEALDERVGEGADVARGDPRLAREDDRGVEADDVVAARDHGLPPLPADVLLELDTEGAVVPGRPGASVDLAAREDEAPALAEADDGVHGGCLLGHAAQVIGPAPVVCHASGVCRRVP